MPTPSRRVQSSENTFLSPFKSPVSLSSSCLSHHLPFSPVQVVHGYSPTPHPSRPATSQPSHTLNSPITPSRSHNGMKRKSTDTPTPLRQHNLAPINITPRSSRENPTYRVPLESLASTASTPRPKNEVDVKKLKTLNRMRISDLNSSEEDLNGQTDCDSEWDVTDDKSSSVFTIPPTGISSLTRALQDHQSGIIGPKDPTLSSPSPVCHPSSSDSNIAFPRFTRVHSRSSSGDSSEGPTSPARRRGRSRLGSMRPPPPPHIGRAPFTRVDSATIFFGSSGNEHPEHRENHTAPLDTSPSARPFLFNRHSYAGHESPWDPSAFSQRQSPMVPQYEEFSTDEDNDPMVLDSMDFCQGLEFSRVSRTPNKDDAVSMVYSEADTGMQPQSSESSEEYTHMPAASMSVGSLCSDADGLVTPGIAPTPMSLWPSFAVHNEENHQMLTGGSTVMAGTEDMDAFILQTLVAGSKVATVEKKAPRTPVKKMKTAHLGGSRPWQSAVARRTRRISGDDSGAPMKKVPRKSLPTSLYSDSNSTQASDSEDDSPTTKKYGGIGIGRPPPGLAKLSAIGWPLRRSSSGAFSSGSDSTSVMGTPTRKKSRDRSLAFPHTVKSAATVSSLHRREEGKRNDPSVRSHILWRDSSMGSAPRTRQSSLGPRSRTKSDITSRFYREFIPLGQLGSGEFGKVVKARRKDGLETEVFAVKISKPFEGVKHRLRLSEEADILRLLARRCEGRTHPNILGFVDSWIEGDRIYIQTELCEWNNLARFLREYGRVYPRLDEARVWKIIVHLSNGLRFIHDVGVIHLDIKPANVFITRDGAFKLGDFGMASIWPRPASPMLGGSFEREGDKLYLAPEVLQGQYGKAADVFSFGVTMLETATNMAVPDQGEAWHRLRTEDFSEADLRESPELFQLIKQMMRTKPSRRIGVHSVYNHPVVSRARVIMSSLHDAAEAAGRPVFEASPLAGVPTDFLDKILNRRIGNCGAMDVCS